MSWESWELGLAFFVFVGAYCFIPVKAGDEPPERPPIKPFTKGPHTQGLDFGQQFGGNSIFGPNSIQNHQALRWQQEQASKAFRDAINRDRPIGQTDPVTVVSTDDRIKQARNITPKPKEIDMGKKKPGGGKPRPKPY